MKFKIIMMMALAVTIMTRSACGMVLMNFQGWDRLEECSADIAIVYTENQTPPGTAPLIGNEPTSDWQVKILSVLKGTNTVSTTRLFTNYELRNHTTYLVFGNYDSTGLNAYEDFCVVPLGNA